MVEAHKSFAAMDDANLGSGELTGRTQTRTMPNREFVHSLRLAPAIPVERNTAAIGLFTPSSKRIGSVRMKVVSWGRPTDTGMLRASVTISPGPALRLPITADQDRFIAFHALLATAMSQNSAVCNPVCFTSADLLKILGKHLDSGKNYREIKGWLEMMLDTTVVSEDGIYLSEQKEWVSGTFRLFERVVAHGQQLDDGTIATCHHVWVSDWLVDNLRNKYSITVDVGSYFRLKNRISKALMMLLAIRAAETSGESTYAISYSEMCSLLNVRQYSHQSKAIGILEPSFRELRNLGYIRRWRFAADPSSGDFTVVLTPGSLMLGLIEGETAARGAERTGTLARLVKDGEPGPGIDQEVLQSLLRRKITMGVAKRMMMNVRHADRLLLQLAWGDTLAPRNGPFGQLPELYRLLIRNDVLPPKTFLLAQDCQTANGREINSQWVEYEIYLTDVLDAYISSNYASPDWEHLVNRRLRELGRLPWTRKLSASALRSLAEASGRAEVAFNLPTLAYHEFAARKSARGNSEPGKARLA